MSTYDLFKIGFGGLCFGLIGIIILCVKGYYDNKVVDKNTISNTWNKIGMGIACAGFIIAFVMLCFILGPLGYALLEEAAKQM